MAHTTAGTTGYYRNQHLRSLDAEARNEITTRYDELVTRGIALAKVQINNDIAAGIVPANVQSFDKLHEYVDANEYGDLISFVKIEDVDDYMELIAMLDDVQRAIDTWIIAGRSN